MPNGIDVPIFPGRPADRRTVDRRRLERAAVGAQLERWRMLRSNPTYRRGTIAILEERRAARPDLAQFESVDNDGSDTFVVSGQLLIRAQDLDDHARAALLASGLVASRIPGLEGDVLQLDEADPDARLVLGNTMAVVDRLRAQGVPVAPSYIGPLGMIRKAEGGPENSAGGGPMPAGVVVAPPRVAVIDTGLATEQRTDGWLRGLVTADNEDLLNVLPDPTDLFLDLGAGHGTFVSGVIQQVAPAVDLHMLRGLDTDGLAAESTLAGLIVTAVRDGAAILNLSWGTDTLDGNPPLSMESAIRTAIQINPEVLIVCAAGNYGDERKCWPAAFTLDFPDNVVAVGALRREPDGELAGADFSNRGPVLKCSTLGQAVVSAYVMGDENPLADPEPDHFDADAWATWSGTSFAAPQVVGAIVALCQSDPTLTPRTALTELLKDAPVIADFGPSIEILSV